MRLGYCITLLLSAIASTAQAYPQYIAKGATTCGSCHYTPAGGGFPTSYGHGSIEATIYSFEWGENIREHVLKGDTSGYDDEGLALQADVMVDVRGLLLGRAPSDNGGEWVGIPMLTEFGVVVAFGPMLLYGGVTLRPPTDPRAIETYIYSREHWIGGRIGETLMLRAGRMAKPFGLRIADHTQYTRLDLDLDMFSQAYGVEVDWTPGNWVLSLAGMVGELVPSWGELEPGVYLSGAYSFSGRASVGASLSMGGTDGFDFTRVSVHGRVRVWQRIYALAEFASSILWTAPPEEQTSLVGYARLGWFATEWLDIYAESGHRYVVGSPLKFKQRYAFGVAWHPLPWVEVITSVQGEEQNHIWQENIQLQLHLIY